MRRRLRPSFVELLHLLVALVLAWNLRGSASRPLQFEGMLFIVVALLVTSAVLAGRCVFHLGLHHWQDGIRALVILVMGGRIWYTARCLWHGPLNPWEQHGVRAGWISVGAAKQLAAGSEVSHQGRLITGSAHANGSYNWALRIEDYNDDGSPDVVLQDGRFIHALIFTPSVNGQPPRFEDIYDETAPP